MEILKNIITSSSSSSLFSVDKFKRFELFVEPSIGADINKPVFGSSTKRKWVPINQK